MANIHVLEDETVNKIAAGEVIERPMAVVKELVENAIDAQATVITVEIEDAGKTLIRVTDNGQGIAGDQTDLAFLPHATSKIDSVSDIFSGKSLGFRGEALASIAAVSQLEMMTKTKTERTGTRYRIQGGEKKGADSIGCPDGTTFLVRNLFYNTPARLKFLKSEKTEASYIGSLMESMALSYPQIAFCFISGKQTKLSTFGDGNLKEVIYQIYGREITRHLIPIEGGNPEIAQISGYAAKPVISRGNRSMMHCFVNGRVVKSPMLFRAIEQAYAPYSMQHRYPFVVLNLAINPQSVDVNVHPQKTEVRFLAEQEVFRELYHTLASALGQKELIPEVSFDKKDTVRQGDEVFLGLSRGTVFDGKDALDFKESALFLRSDSLPLSGQEKEPADYFSNGVQESLFGQDIAPQERAKDVRIVGQVFATYWILQYNDNMYLVDQHAAHEKVLYERLTDKMKEKTPMTQMVDPPVILTLSLAQEQAVKDGKDALVSLGYRIEPFGGREYAVSGVPAHLPDIGTQELLSEIIDAFAQEQERIKEPQILSEKLAMMSCKAAVKGNRTLPKEQMLALFLELMTLKNPYNCPHGRPTMICIKKAELEKRFKRIL